LSVQVDGLILLNISTRQKNRLFCICHTLFLFFSFVRTYCILNLLGVVFVFCLSLFFFDVGCSDFLFSCSRKTNPISFFVYNLLYYNTCVIFSKKTKSWYLTNSIWALTCWSFFMYVHIQLFSLSVFFVLREQFLVDSLEEQQQQKWRKKISLDLMLLLLWIVCSFRFFLCNFCFWFSVCLFRAPVLLFIDKKKEKIW
jgi:hypothetical protein